uniref:non-specific serine/threonine protein kinase n=1 Tax=Vitis vinifera TaxID=29760 RepID=A0A2S1TYF8_VITVI|nr:lysine motif-containing receptor-like kinase 1-1 protein [Vitis vinifera]WBP50028.1 LysM receptor-like kinase 1-1 [Vitis vinifera]
MKQKVGLGFFVLLSVFCAVDSQCSRGCDLALGSYYVWQGSNLTFISQLFQTTISEILSYNSQIANQDSVEADTRIRVPYSSCDCINGEFLGKVFNYTVHSGDTYDLVAETYYSNLTTSAWLQNFNSYAANQIPDTDAYLNVTLNCSCGNSTVSKDYGLFLSYPLRPEDNLTSVAESEGLNASLLQSYNPDSNFSAGSGLVYIPTKDTSGSYRALKSSTGISGGVIAGISIAAVVGVLLLTVCIYIGFYRKRKVKEAALLPTEEQTLQPGHGPGIASDKAVESTGPAFGSSAGLTGITVDKSVEFSYEELAKATDNFNLANKIGQGGFGSVYYAELRGEKAAIKKMDMQASREFLAELKVLTHVHHLNLVRLIGYCVEGSLFLVYEYIENGNLSQHLRGSGRDPLQWSSRVQIALDSARGLEYIHEHTVPVYIHRDIKSANILIDKNFHGKVADFGLTKLTEVGSSSLPTRLVGTFGYMPPEYAQYGDVSPKVDVYAFGVVLYELISAKEAVVKENGSVAESKGLVALFEDVLNKPDPREDLRRLVDARLEDNYPLDSVRKMAQLAKACTQENPQLRPSMRTIVVALMTLSSSTEDWDVGSFYDNQALVNLMSGR